MNWIHFACKAHKAFAIHQVVSLFNQLRSLSGMSLVLPFLLLLLAIFSSCTEQSQKHNIIVVSYPEGNTLGGGFTYEISLYKALVKHGVDTELVVIKNPLAEQFLIKNNIPHHYCSIAELEETLLRVAKDKRSTIIHTSAREDCEIAQRVKQQLPVKIVATLHIESAHDEKIKLLAKTDGIIAVSERVARSLKNLREKEQWDLDKIIHIPPFFDDAPFRDIDSKVSSSKFVNDNFGITINNDMPIITSVAHFYSNDKNHTVLIKAIDLLINQYHMPCHLMLAGDGPRKESMMQLVHDLKLESYIHFLGNLDREYVPELLWHSTIKALTSDTEGTGVVLLEAAMLKKPLIGTRGTGMEVVIKDQETGLLFEKNNEHDLAAKLLLLLRNPLYAQELGEGAYTYVKKNLTNDVHIKTYLAFLTSLYH